ncbi:protein trichome birefringence-like 21 [Nymphaea colorata]|uniref:protein trichome birefringence-like 21 n=1 Tax=Nymphaea colorata TaxID=210225 RepID=UPI00214E2E75|nr:protein trichome birefringence-like 21 [Nymphaea colorata]
MDGVSKGTDEKYKRWHYTTYNFTIHALWSEFLVNGKKTWPRKHRQEDYNWCLPGPIGTWNDFRVQMLKMENPSS